MLADLAPPCVTVLNGHSATLGWLGCDGPPHPRARRHRFGQTGTVADLYRHHSLDAAASPRAAQTLTPARSIHYLRAL